MRTIRKHRAKERSMSDHQASIDRLVVEAMSMGAGQVKVALLEEAVRLADVHGDTEMGFDLRQDLMEAAVFAGRPDLLLVAFTWCVAQHDRDPEKFAARELLWKYKWVVTHLPEFPQISRRQIEDILAEMARRFAQAGSTMHAVYHKRGEVHMLMGDRQAAAEAYALMARTQCDWLSDCRACIPDNEVEYLVINGRDEEALARARPILTGRLACAEVPQRTYASILLPLLRLGRAAEAMAYHRKGYRQIAGNAAFLRHAAMHLVFLALTDNLPKAVKLLEKHLAMALGVPSQASRFEFLLASRLLLERLAEQGQKAMKLRLPAAFPLHNAQGRYQVADLLAWFGGQLQELAVRFDTRNGNDEFSQRIAGLQELKKLVTPCPLSARE
jgi:hypothetical protein